MKRILGYLQPLSMILIVNAIGFSLLYFYKKTFDVYILGAGITVVTIIGISYFFNLRKNLGDEYLLMIVSMLSSIGIIMLYRIDRSRGLKQVVWFTIGVLIFFVTHYVFTRIKSPRRFVYLYVAAAIGLYMLTLVAGTSIKGSKNWIIIGGINLQPSEVIKTLYVLFLASYFSDPDCLMLDRIIGKKLAKSIGNKLFANGIAFVFMGFLILQKEWGTTLLFFLVYFGMMFVFNSSRLLLALNVLAAAAGGVVGYFKVYHVKVRVDTWLNPWKDIAGKGYQITQSLFAIGTGGFVGTGLGMGRPELIPEVSGDFIFSAICEELGIITGVAIVLLYFVLTYRGFKIALSPVDKFSKALALGITMMFGFQTFIIIGGVIKLIPLTGITLPFISYGGSSLTASFMSLGILHALSDKSYEAVHHEQDGGAA